MNIDLQLLAKAFVVLVCLIVLFKVVSQSIKYKRSGDIPPTHELSFIQIASIIAVITSGIVLFSVLANYAVTAKQQLGVIVVAVVILFLIIVLSWYANKET